MVEGCLVHVLSEDGYALYLRRPHGGDRVLVGFQEQGWEADQIKQRLRRVLLGIVHEALRIQFGPEERKGA